MPYITSIERMGREEGIQQGRREGEELGRVEALRQAIVDVIETRFGQVPADLRSHVEAATDSRLLQEFHRFAIRCPSLAECQRQLAALARPS